MIGPLTAAALLLAVAGLAKVRAPRARSALAAAGLPGARLLPGRLGNRLLGLVELAVAVAAVLLGGRPQALLVAVGYAVLALLSARMVAAEAGQDCGCFARPAPVSHCHTAVNAIGAAFGVAGLLAPADPLPAVLRHDPVPGVALLLAAAALAYLGYLTMTALPALRSAAARLEGAR